MKCDRGSPPPADEGELDRATICSVTLAGSSAVADRDEARAQRAELVGPQIHHVPRLGGRMPTGGKFQNVPVDQIELDEENPRIAPFLEHMEPPYSEANIFLALGAGGDDEGGGLPGFNKLRQSIQTNGGVVSPVILRQVAAGKFLCIEGNTRVQLYREFKTRETAGDWDTIPAIVHASIGEDDVHAIRLQAHLVGPRPWTPYAKAKYLTQLREKEHFPFSRLVDFCGGNERSIVESLNAYADMEKHYRPHLPSDEDFDTTRFSGFVEAQKPGVKEAIARAGFTMDDFGRWIIDGKIEKLAHVRWIPKILKDKKATEVFLKNDIEDAIRMIDTPDLNKALQEANLVSLARALTGALRRIEFREVKKLKDDPASQTAQHLLEAYEAIGEIITEIGTDPT